MMAFTTLIIAVPIVIVLYLFVISKVTKPKYSYISVFAVSILLFMIRSIHFAYIGIEVLLIGFITVYLRDKFLTKKHNK